MRKKFLSIVTIVTMLFGVIGCGGDSSSKSTNSSATQTNLTIEFKSAKQAKEGYQKVSRDDVAKVFITIAKNGTAYLDNAPMVKDSVTNKWSIGVNLDNALAPYDVLVVAKDASDNVLFRSKAGSTIASLSANVVLVVEEVIPSDVVSTNLPSVKSITHNSSGNTIDIHFVINNATNYELSSTSGGTFATSSGILSTTTEAVLDAVYTKGASETDAFLSIKLFNADGDSRTIPFNISEGSNTLSINFPPSVNIDVAEQLIPTNSYKITATVTDDDSTSWTYAWNRIRGAKLIPTDNTTPHIAQLEGLSGGELYPMCFNLTVTDDEGASASVDYCIKNADNGYVGLKKTGQTKSYDQAGEEVTDGSVKDDGFYQKGLTPQYTRDDVAQTVTDHVTGLVWQDDEDAKTLTKTWSDAKAYCESKGNGWHLPTLEELKSIYLPTKETQIDSNYFRNLNRGFYWSDTEVWNSSSDVWVIIFKNSSIIKDSKFDLSYTRCLNKGK